jgi:hypothetical protein
LPLLSIYYSKNFGEQAAEKSDNAGSENDVIFYGGGQHWQFLKWKALVNC